MIKDLCVATLPMMHILLCSSLYQSNSIASTVTGFHFSCKMQLQRLKMIAGGWTSFHLKMFQSHLRGFHLFRLWVAIVLEEIGQWANVSVHPEQVTSSPGPHPHNIPLLTHGPTHVITWHRRGRGWVQGTVWHQYHTTHFRERGNPVRGRHKRRPLLQ